MAYSPEEIKEKFDLIIHGIEVNGKSLRQALQGYLSSKTFFEWLEEDEEKVKQYARACEIRADNLFDEILDIADESNADISFTDEGRMTIDGQAIQRSKLRIEARQWVLGKLNPKKYGTKVQTELSGDVNINLKDMVKFDNTKQ